MAHVAVPVVEHYRFAKDDSGGAFENFPLQGTEDSSYEVAQADLDTAFCVIFKWYNNGAADTATDDAFQLQVDVDGGGYNDVNATSSNVRTIDDSDADSSFVVTGGDILSAISGHSWHHAFHDDADSLIDDDAVTMPSGRAGEYYFAIQFRSADLSGGETLAFRMLFNGATITQNVPPTATIAAALAAGVNPSFLRRRRAMTLPIH